MAGKPFVFSFADIEVREREFSLVKSGEAVAVEPKAFRVLLILLRNPQKLISKDELLNAVWGDTAVSENSLARSIAVLRRLLGDDTRNPRYIETVATVGYRFLCKVEAYEDAQGALETTEEPPEQVVDPSVSPAKDQKKREERTRSFNLRHWLISTGVIVTLSLAAAVWYLRRPLPPPRISAYTQITREGHYKLLRGTDGNRLYFTLVSPRSVAQVGVSGGEIAPVPLTIPGELGGLVDVSPNGSNLLIASSQAGSPVDTLWSVQTLGGSYRRVAESDSAAFSPDGKLIAYSTGSGEIWVMRNDGSEARRLATIGGPFSFIAWSPEGNLIRFTREGRIWEIESNGSNLRPLFLGRRLSGSQCCGRWTPDGNFFIFLSATSVDSSGQIWALDERRGLLRRPPAEPLQLTVGPIAWRTPLPGKDGKHIFTGGVTSRGELTRFDPLTKQPQPFLGGISALGVSFSKDGKFIAYVSHPEGILWKANRDGSSPLQLTQSPINALLPRWSPDGSQIVFVDASSQDHSQILTVSSEGGAPQALLPADNSQPFDPDWSTDGRKILFSCISGDQGKGVIQILDLASRKRTEVPGSLGLYSPRLSPDGRFLAAISNDETTLKIFSFETQKWSTLLQTKFLGYPSWSKDGRFIYFSGAGSDPNVFRIRVAGGEPEQIVSLKGLHITGWFGWVGLDPTDSLLVLRDTGTDDIYALTLEQK